MSNDRRATATLVVQYQDPSGDATIKAEIDTERSGGTIYIGDPVYYKVYADCDYTQITSSGNTTPVANNVSEQKKDIITFGGTDTASLGYPYYDSGSMAWYGNSFDLTWPIIGKSELKIPGYTSDLQRWTIAGAGEATYNTKHNLYLLQANLPVVVIFILQSV